MKKIAIIIPSRLDAQRLPNKPLKLINNKEMILHVYDAAIKSNTGEVYVATPDQKIVDAVKNSGGASRKCITFADKSSALSAVANSKIKMPRTAFGATVPRQRGPSGAAGRY